jgi:hypothetical protein
VNAPQKNWVQQVELRALGVAPNPFKEDRLMVSWLEAFKVKPGDSVVLKDMENIVWLVESVGREHERSDIKRGWGMTDYFGKESDRK